MPAPSGVLKRPTLPSSCSSRPNSLPCVGVVREIGLTGRPSSIVSCAISWTTPPSSKAIATTLCSTIVGSRNANFLAPVGNVRTRCRRRTAMSWTAFPADSPRRPGCVRPVRPAPACRLRGHSRDSRCGVRSRQVSESRPRRPPQHEASAIAASCEHPSSSLSLRPCACAAQSTDRLAASHAVAAPSRIPTGTPVPCFDAFWRVPDSTNRPTLSIVSS